VAVHLIQDALFEESKLTNSLAEQLIVE